MKSAAPKKDKLLCFLRVPNMPVGNMEAIGAAVKDAIKKTTNQDTHVVITSFELEFISKSELKKLLK